MDLNRNYLRNISRLDFVTIQILLWEFERYFISLFPIRYLLVSEFDIEYKPIYFLFKALYLISNVIWVYRESCFRWHWFFNPVKGKMLIFEKIKTKWSFNESLIRLKCELIILIIKFEKWSRVEYHQFCSKAIVKSLIRFEREMVINFTDNTVELDVEYYQFSPWDI